MAKLTDYQRKALVYLSKSPYPEYDHGWRETGKACTLPTARKLEALGLVELKVEIGEHRVFTGGFIKSQGGSQTHLVTFLDARARLTPDGKKLVALLK